MFFLLLSQDGTINIPVSPTPPQCLPPQPQNPTQRSTLPKRKQSIQNQGCSLDWENAREIFTSEVQCITQHSQTIPELHHIQPHITIGHNPSPTPTQRPTPTKMKQSIQNQGCSLDWETAREIFTSGAQHITQKSQTTLELRQIHTDIPIYHISTNCIPYNCISSHCIAPNPASPRPTSSDSTPSHCSTKFPLHHLLFTAAPTPHRSTCLPPRHPRLAATPAPHCNTYLSVKHLTLTAEPVRCRDVGIHRSHIECRSVMDPDLGITGSISAACPYLAHYSGYSCLSSRRSYM